MSQKSSDGLRRFRITPWPSVPLPSLGIEWSGNAPTDLVDGQWIESTWRDLPQLPDELYLREAMEVDVNNSSSVFDFTAAYGFLSEPTVASGPLYARPQPGWLGVDPLASDSLRRAVGRRAMATGGTRRWQNRSFRHIGEEALHLRYLRFMVSAWNEIQRSDGRPDPRNVEWIGDDPQGATKTDPVYDYFVGAEGRPETAHQVVIVFSRCLTRALNGVFPHLAYRMTPVPPTYLEAGLREDEEFGGADTRHGPTTFTAMAVQLFNHVIEEALYVRCANKTCGRLFVRQRGRAAYGQHRTEGVMYCSASCAKAQAAREYRRRKKAASSKGERKAKGAG